MPMTSLRMFVSFISSHTSVILLVDHQENEWYNIYAVERFRNRRTDVVTRAKAVVHWYAILLPGRKRWSNGMQCCYQSDSGGPMVCNVVTRATAVVQWYAMLLPRRQRWSTGMQCCYQGDSGGPLVCKDSRGVFTQYGVAAFVLGEGNDPCLSVTVYTDVAHFSDWLDRTIRDNLD